MITEIRNYGDGKTIVLYTDDNNAYQQFKDSVKCVDVIPYWQEQKDHTRMVGADLYFRRRWIKWLQRKTKAAVV